MTRKWLPFALFLAALAIGSGCGKGERAPDTHESEGAVPAATVEQIGDAAFDQAVADGVVLVDFWAPWCGPCRTQGPIVDQLAEQMSGKARFIKVNVDEAPQTARRFGIQSIPTLMVFKDGQKATQFVGVTDRDRLAAAVQAQL